MHLSAGCSSVARRRWPLPLRSTSLRRPGQRQSSLRAAFEFGCVIPDLGGGCLQFGQFRVLDGPTNVNAQCAGGKRPVSLQTTVDNAFAFGDYIMADGTVTTDLSQATVGKAKDPGGTLIHTASVQLVCADAM